MGMLRPEDAISKDDLKKLKEQVFGPNVFWVTETRATDDVMEGGMLVSHLTTAFDTQHSRQLDQQCTRLSVESSGQSVSQKTAAQL